MNARFDRERLRKWLVDIASTEDNEVDCDALDDLLETVVAVGASGEDLRAILPQVALHMVHCPECAEWYETLVALSHDTE